MELTLDEALQRGVEAYGAGQLQEAARLYTAILKAQPQHPDANHNMGVLAFGVGKIQEALPYFEKAAEVNPSIGQYWLSYIEALIKLDRIVDAKAVLAQAKDKCTSGQAFDQLAQQLSEPSSNLPDPSSEDLQPIINLFTQGQLQQALSYALEMLERFPNSVVLYNITGVFNARLMRFDAAIDSYKRALNIKPDYATTHINMGSALKDMGDPEAAIGCYRQALKIKPDYAEAYYNMGMALNDKGDPQAAIGCYKQALKIKPDYADAYNNIGIALQGKGDLEGAIESYKQALQIKPDYAKVYYNMGRALYDKGDLEIAIDSYTQAININPDYAEAYNNVGIVLQDKGDSDEAIKSYKQALKINPDYAEGHNNMGSALQDKGDLEAAIESYKKALKLKPNYAEAHRHLSSLICYKKNNQHFLKMQSLYLDPSITDEQRCPLSFALSKASEDLNDIAQSFTYLKMGNELRKKTIPYDTKQDAELFSQLKKAYPDIAKVALLPASETSKITPIFILGMPRSGTTLVEQIVSSHSEVTGAGELGDVEKFGHSIATGVIKPSTKIILDFRQSYLEALKKRSGDRSIVTDKMPWNFRFVGLILSAFPDAKVIHVSRDPAATCWSNYKHYFANKVSSYGYDLNDTVAYFGLYQNLMQFWQGDYGDRIYNLNYDKLTLNQEDETRKLIQHLGLVWEDDCLSPQSNKRSVRTVSNQQVRQRVYQGSSQQWRKFERYLNGAFDQLTVLD